MKKLKIPILIILIITALWFVLTSIYKDMPAEELKKKYGGGTSQFIDVDGMQVHYRDEGKGPVLVLIHGIIASLHTWDGWVKELSGKYRVIRLDVPGYGLTGPANFDYSRDNYIKFLNNFFNKLGLKKFYLAGNSFGGYLSWSYTVFHPERVNKLILIDSAGYAMEPPFPIKVFLTPVIGYIGSRITPKFVISFNLNDVYGDKNRVTDEIKERYFELFLYPGNRQTNRKLFRFIRDKVAVEPVDLDTIKIPTLIMWGDKDRWIPPAHSKRFTNDITGSKSIVYSGAGHIPMEEIPVKTSADAHRFLAGQQH